MVEDGTKKKRKQGGYRTLPFILSNEVCDKFAITGFNANIVTYLTQQLHLSMLDASNILTNFGGTAGLTPIIGALIADSFAGRFWVITGGSIMYQLGMTILTLSAVIPSLRPPPCSFPSPTCRRASGLQLTFLYLSLLFKSIGTGGIRPCVVAFGADQFDFHSIGGQSWNFFNLYFFTMESAVLLAMTVVVFIQENVSWGWGFGIPSVAMFLAVVAFGIGYPLYVKVKPGGSPMTRVAQVMVAAFKKRKVAKTTDPSLLYENKELDAALSTNGSLLHTNHFSMTGSGRSTDDIRDEQGGSTAASHPMSFGDGEFAQPSISPAVGADPASVVPASRSSHTSESSSTIGRTVLRLDARGLFIEQHHVSSHISAVFQRRADPSGYDWRHVSADTREFYFSEFQKKFTWDPASHDAIRAAWEALTGRRYSDMLHRWRSSAQRPAHVPEGIWHGWQQAWDSDGWRRRSASASTNRRSEKDGPGTGLSRHTSGSISIQEHRRRMSEQEGGDPGEFRLFRATHTRMDGSWVDTRSREVATRVEELRSQASQVDSTDGEAPVELSSEESRRVFLEAVGAQPRDRMVYGLGTRASAYFPHQASSSRYSGDIPAERMDDIRRSIRQDIEHEFDQRMASRDRELADVRDQMRRLEDIVARLSQGLQPPQPPRDRSDS